MKPIRYRSTWLDGRTREHEGYPTGVPGLLVDASACPHGEEPIESWAVIHFRSGARTACGFTSPEAALATAQALAGTVDWTLTAPEMKAAMPSLARAVDAAAELYGGHAGVTRQPDTAPIDNGVMSS